FPLKVAAIGEGAPIGFADEPRPPGSVPSRQPLANYAPRPAYYDPPQQTYPSRPQYGAPAAMYPQRPQYGAPAPYEPVPYEPAPDNRTPSYGHPYPQQSYPRGEQVPLGRESAPLTAGSVAVQPTATLACPIVSALDTWFASGVQPAALKWFGV